MDHLCSPGGHKGADAKDECWLTSMPISIHISVNICPPFWLHFGFNNPESPVRNEAVLIWMCFAADDFISFFTTGMLRHFFPEPATGVIMTVIIPSVHPEIKWHKYRTIGCLWEIFLMLEIPFKTVRLREGHTVYLTPFNWFLLRLCESQRVESVRASSQTCTCVILACASLEACLHLRVIHFVPHLKLHAPLHLFASCVLLLFAHNFSAAEKSGLWSGSNKNPESVVQKTTVNWYTDICVNKLDFLNGTNKWSVFTIVH